MATVASVEPVSTTTISSAKPCTERRHSPRRASSSRTIIERLSMAGRLGVGARLSAVGQCGWLVVVSR